MIVLWVAKSILAFFFYILHVEIPISADLYMSTDIWMVIGHIWSN